jgi:hypothetical protein
MKEEKLRLELSTGICMQRRKRENSLIKNNITRDVDPTRGRFNTFISVVLIIVAQEHATGGTK